MDGRPVILALVGMSGVGKSHHAALLAKQGFVHHDVDAAIALRIGDLCLPHPGERPVEAVGRWMGMPWLPGRAEREAQYLALEAELTEAALSAATRAASDAGDHVIDTTGSVIYLPPATLARLRALATVVHLASRPEHIDAMLLRYLSEPKPVVWGEHWAPRAGASHEEALADGYPRLLSFREARYAALAHRSVDGRHVTTDALLTR
jgi:hypothetical protein